jgi:hypothetical protein
VDIRERSPAGIAIANENKELFEGLRRAFPRPFHGGCAFDRMKRLGIQGEFELATNLAKAIGTSFSKKKAA